MEKDLIKLVIQNLKSKMRKNVKGYEQGNIEFEEEYLNGERNGNGKNYGIENRFNFFTLTSYSSFDQQDYH